MAKVYFLLIPVFIIGLLFSTASVAVAQAPVGTVRGQVIDDANQPVEAANVSIEGSAIRTTTAANGSFLLEVPAGRHTLVISRTGFKAIKNSIQVKAGETLALNLTLGKGADLTQVEVTGRTQSQEVRNQGFQVNVIDLKTKYNTTSDINQVLNQTTGVRIREEGGLGSNFNFSLNGFTGNQVKFFIDGIPMDNFGASLTLNNFPVNIAERIEVYKGVLPVSLGTDALGGAVNIISRANQNYVDASYSFGSFNTHRPAVSAAFTDKKTGFTLRTNVFYNYSDNNYKVLVPVRDLNTRDLGPEQWVRRFHDKYQSATAQVEVGVTGKSYADKLLLGVIASENKKDIQTGVVMDAVYGALRSKSHSLIPTLKYKKSDLFTRGLDFNLYSAYNTNNFTLIDTTARNYNWLGESVVKPSAGTGGGGGEISRTRNENKNREVLVNASWIYRINDWQTLALNDIYTNYRRTSYDSENPDVYTNRFPSELVKNTVGLAWNADVQHKWISSVFVKYYAMKATGYQQVNALTDSARYEAVNFTYGHPGYGAATAYFITPALQVKASYEHAYRMPEGNEIFGDGVFVIYSPGLKPEKSDNYNLGVRYSKLVAGAHSVGAEVGLIYRNTDDFIRVDQSTTGGNRTTLNQGKVQTKGIEGELSYSYKGRFFASVNGTYQRLVDKEEFQRNNGFGGGVTRNFTYNYRLPNIPYLFANANAGANFPVKGNNLSLTYTLNFVQNYYLTFAELGSSQSNKQYIIPEQFAHNVYASYAIKKGMYNISAECRNFTNSLLFDAYRLQKPGRTFTIKLRYFFNKKES